MSDLHVDESNYDEQPLENNKYPYYLKNRILSDTVHLGNHQTINFPTDIINDKLINICPAHLSKNNNTPEIALQTL
jgi:phosphoribosyl 1,2-cyclic phosphodiesterase